jgi:hypothetical protein
VEVTVLTRAAGIAGVVALLSACGGPERSPFVLWWEGDAFGRPTGGIRPGMPLDSVALFWIQRDGLQQNANVWDRCAPVGAGARRCERGTVTPRGRFDVVAAADGRVVYLAFAPATRDIIFDDSLTWMQRPWWRTRGARLDPHGVSDANPYGVAEFRFGRWRAFNTFDGKRCENTLHPRPCPSLIQLVDWRNGRQYADMTVPH